MVDCISGNFWFISDDGSKFEISAERAGKLLLEDFISNFKYEVGPNKVINNEEVKRIGQIIYNQCGKFENQFLILASADLYEMVELYDKKYDLNNVHIATQIAVEMSRILIERKDCSGLIFPLLAFKDRLFEIYLLDNKYYREMASAFYHTMGFEPWASNYGFYDCRWNYDIDNAKGTTNAIDSDYVVIPDFYARVCISLAEEGYVCEYEQQCREIVSFAEEFWMIIAHDMTHPIMTWRGKSNWLFNKAITGESVSRNGYFSSEWMGLAYLISITHRKYRKQISIAKKMGCPTLENVKDVRKNIFFPVVLAAAFVSFLIFLIYDAVIHKSYIFLFLLGISSLFAFAYVFLLSPKGKEQVDKDLREQAVIAREHTIFTGAYYAYYLYLNPYEVHLPIGYGYYLLHHPEERWLLF